MSCCIYFGKNSVALLLSTIKLCDVTIYLMVLTLMCVSVYECTFWSYHDFTLHIVTDSILMLHTMLYSAPNLNWTFIIVSGTCIIAWFVTIVGFAQSERLKLEIRIVVRILDHQYSMFGISERLFRFGVLYVCILVKVFMLL